MGPFFLGLLAAALGIPVAAFLAAPYPIRLAISIVWKIYVVVAACLLAKWMLSPLFGIFMELFNLVRSTLGI